MDTTKIPDPDNQSRPRRPHRVVTAGERLAIVIILVTTSWLLLIAVVWLSMAALFKLSDSLGQEMSTSIRRSIEKPDRTLANGVPGIGHFVSCEHQSRL